MSVKFAPTSVHVKYTCTRPAFIFITAISNHLGCLVHLHQLAPDQQAYILQLHPTSSQESNTHLQYADLLLSFFADTLHIKSKKYFLFFFFFFFGGGGKFYPSIYRPLSSLFFPHCNSKKVCILSKHCITKLSVVSCVQYTLAFISSFF